MERGLGPERLNFAPMGEGRDPSGRQRAGWWMDPGFCRDDHSWM